VENATAETNGHRPVEGPPRYATCGAKTRHDGSPCERPAGWGTENAGVPGARCKLHGGSTPNQLQHVAVLEAERSIATLNGDATLALRPGDALLRTVKLAGEAVERIRSEATSEDVSPERLRGFVLLYGDWIDRLARVSKAALDARVEERSVEEAARIGDGIADAILAAFAELGLSEEERERARPILERHLLRLERPAGAEHNDRHPGGF
jgi:hypothetical protein